jgi:Spy/CpxP family protein refolding chaperone
MKSTVVACSIALVVVLFRVAPFAGSQGQGAPPSKWWQSDFYKRELSLTPEQSKHLEDIFQAAKPNQTQLKKSLDEAEALFEKLVKEGDKKAAAKQIDRVTTARAELIKSHSLMLLDMRFELTAQQWTKLGQLQQQALETQKQQRAPDKSK